MKIHLKCDHTIKGKFCSDSTKQRFLFRVPSKDNSVVTVDIIPEENRVESFYEFNVSDEIWTMIQNDLDKSHLPEEFKDILSDMASVISNATQKVLGLIKYCFSCTSLDENLLSNTHIYWSRDKLKWKKFCPKPHAAFDKRSIINLNEKKCQRHSKIYC